MLLIPIQSYASENFVVQLYKDTELITLNSSRRTHIIYISKEYLNACRKYEDVTGTTFTQNEARDRLYRITTGDYIKITFPNDTTDLPIAHGNQKFDKILIGIDNRGFPDLITVHDEKIQLYTKCSGTVAITKFSCNKVLSELLSFKTDVELCKIMEQSKD
ncbi:MAG: hypothetical protein GWN50_05960 [Candidatus Dadabacteria bacterium]|nr:hypothetical protein [Candidatus Dadabacteria bacterium]